MHTQLSPFQCSFLGHSGWEGTQNPNKVLSKPSLHSQRFFDGLYSSFVRHCGGEQLLPPGCELQPVLNDLRFERVIVRKMVVTEQMQWIGREEDYCTYRVCRRSGYRSIPCCCPVGRQAKKKEGAASVCNLTTPLWKEDRSSRGVELTHWGTLHLPSLFLIKPPSHWHRPFLNSSFFPVQIALQQPSFLVNPSEHLHCPFE